MLIIATETFNEHLRILTAVLKALKSVGLKLNLKKCKFAYHELDYLGYHVNCDGIRPNNEHLNSMQRYPTPTSHEELERCLALFSIFRRFVCDFSRIARPLTDLKKKASFQWTAECDEAFSNLRYKLVNSPVLAVYNPTHETELHTDASSRGYGSVLLQRKEDKRFHTIAYYSKCTSEAESKCHSFELETLAIIYSLKRIRVYLEGIPFTIFTDCNSLTLTLNKKLINPRIARWALELENYDFSIRHRRGELMSHFDALSRAPIAAMIDAGDIDLNIQITQVRDPRIQTIRTELECGDMEDYKSDNGLIFRINKHGHRQLYVPGEMEANIMALIHEKYGHGGINKCMKQIKKHYFFRI